MSEAIVSYDVRSLIDQWMEAERNGEQFPVPFHDFWDIAGHNKKQDAVSLLESLLTKDSDYLRSTVNNGKRGRPSYTYFVTCDGLKHWALASQTEAGRNIRQYFIEAEKKWQMVKSVAPEFAQQIELAKIQYELEREKNRGKELDNTMLQLHGDRVVLALRGYRDQIIEKETIVTEVVEADTGKSTKILSADQLKKAVLERTGQKLKSMKSFTDAIRESGRDDLLVPVKRAAPVSEYISPDKLDEALNIVYGKNRQTLLGE